MNRSNERGGILATTVHVVLLVAVLGQVVYLASRYRTRWDLTSDQMWSLTESTRSIVGRLDKQLLIEAYFSPKEGLPVTMRDTRVVLDNFLDELVQLGKGRVVVQRFDPNSDKAISDRCTRVGVQPVDLRGQSATSISVDRHWQGLRLVYGGSKQKVLAQIAPQSSFVAEAQITPAIKEVVTTAKRKFGYMEWPATAYGGGRQPNPQGLAWNVLRTHEGIARRFEFQNYKSEDAPLVPDDVDTLFLFRPKELTDRMKYVIDQFVVGGGTLVVFADASEYTITEQRAFTRVPLNLDSTDSEKKFVDQLAHYGVDWKTKVLADMSGEAHRPRNIAQPQEYFSVQQQTVFGMQFRMVPYPYFFHAVAGDWANAAEQLARNAEGELDEALAERYREQFEPGIPSDEFLFTTFKKVGRGPGFYWPTWVGLRTKAGGLVDLPEGIEGRVHMWSSPAVLAEDPPQNLYPVGRGDPRRMVEEHQKFLGKLNERFTAEPRQQAPLMCEVSGRFTSFFASGERPMRPSEVKEAEARAAAENPDEPKDGEDPPPDADPIGPPKPPAADAPDAAEAKPEPERDMITAGERPGRIVMIGDSDFVRDDLVRGDYARVGGPYSTMGGAFFNNLLDWLAEDRDLVALQSRATVDRTLKFVETPPPGTDPRVAEQALNRKTTWLRFFNIALPGVLLGLFGLLVFLLRRRQKRSFLESVG